MEKSGKSLFDRIGSVKNSLENAEQSFKDNQDMRGELDLMLAEAELKNLRRKKDTPWTWNRHLLAVCVAFMVVFGGMIGWYFAMDQYQSVSATSAPSSSNSAKIPQGQNSAKDYTPEAKNSGKNIKNKLEETKANSTQVTISKNDMRRLVQSARVELSNSK